MLEEIIKGLFGSFFVVFLLTFAYFQYIYSYWKKKGVPHLVPSFPLGNSKTFTLDTHNYSLQTKDWYKELKRNGLQFGGVWDLCKPALVLVDPDYIRDILSKDFQYFANRDHYYGGSDPKREHLFLVENEKWKNMRQKLTPTFTSGKIKTMFHTVVRCSDVMIDYMKKDKEHGRDINIKQVLSSFTIDVIAHCAFGIEANSFENPNSEFRIHGLQHFHADRFTKLVKYTLVRMCPKLCKKFGLSLQKENEKDFFTELIKETIEYRGKNGDQRSDFMQLLMDLLRNSDNHDNLFDFDSLVANTILFFVAGFDTSSSTMNFALFELAKNSDIQEKARAEIFEVLKRHDGQLTYDSIKEMTYLRQVIDETLRLYPPAPTLTRSCVKEYTLRDSNITLEKGTPIVIPIFGLQRDPDYYSDPEVFNPDRFRAEDKAKRLPYVYLPFGEGPRNCIGLRFGLMQSSIGLIQILTNFRISISPSTKMPLTLNERSFLLRSNETVYLKMESIYKI